MSSHSGVYSAAEHSTTLFSPSERCRANCLSDGARVGEIQDARHDPGIWGKSGGPLWRRRC